MTAVRVSASQLLAEWHEATESIPHGAYPDARAYLLAELLTICEDRPDEVRAAIGRAVAAGRKAQR